VKYIICISALTFWPAIVFWNQLTVDIPKFTEEWIKICTSGLIFYLILESIRKRQKAESESNFISSFIEGEIGPHLEYILHLFVNRRAELEKERTQVIHKWKYLGEKIGLAQSIPLWGTNNILNMRLLNNIINSREVLQGFKHIESFEDDLIQWPTLINNLQSANSVIEILSRRRNKS